MHPLIRGGVVAMAALSIHALPSLAQHHDMNPAAARCTLCQPWVYAEGAALFRADDARPSATAENWTPLVRAIIEIGTPTKHLGFFTHLEFTPDDGASPTLTYGAQLWMLPRFSRFNLTGGIGLTHARGGIGDASPGAYQVRGWGHVGAEIQTPLHEIALYGQVGTDFVKDLKPVYQVGLRHPIAPWRFHVMP